MDDGHRKVHALREESVGVVKATEKLLGLTESGFTPNTRTKEFAKCKSGADKRMPEGDSLRRLARALSTTHSAGVFEWTSSACRSTLGGGVRSRP